MRFTQRIFIRTLNTNDNRSDAQPIFDNTHAATTRHLGCYKGDENFSKRALTRALEMDESRAFVSEQVETVMAIMAHIYLVVK